MEEVKGEIDWKLIASKCARGNFFPPPPPRLAKLRRGINPTRDFSLNVMSIPVAAKERSSSINFMFLFLAEDFSRIWRGAPLSPPTTTVLCLPSFLLRPIKAVWKLPQWANSGSG